MKYETMDAVDLFTEICVMQMELGFAIAHHDIDEHDRLDKELTEARQLMIRRLLNHEA